MFTEVWNFLLGYLKDQPYWNRVQPLILFILLYVITGVGTYQYVQWQYGLAPSPPEFIRSYLFKQISVAYLVLAGVILILRFGRVPASEAQDWGGWFNRSRSALLTRAIAMALLFALGGYVWLKVTPIGVADIRIKFDPPNRSLRHFNFDPYTFTYLVYELNRQQRSWHFEVDLTPFDQELLSSREAERCKASPAQLLCAARAYLESLGGKESPLVLITHQQFTEFGYGYYYWLHNEKVSLISASDWAQYNEPTIYDYLFYSTIIQSILIHVDVECGAFQHREGGLTRGEIFEFQPDPQLMLASILSAHLSRQMRELLFNCFGPAYAADANELLSLHWLHDDRVQHNLNILVQRPKF